MAVDSRDKRFSLIGFGSPAPRILPDAAGALDADDRAMLLFLYPGIALASPVVVDIVTVAVSLYLPNPMMTMYTPDAAAALSVPNPVAILESTA